MHCGLNNLSYSSTCTKFWQLQPACPCCTGKDVYVDLNGWHLHLQHITAKDNFKLSQALAMAIGPEAKAGISDKDLEDFLKKVPLQLGQGKAQVSLFDAIPKSGIRNLSNAIKDYKYQEER